jgi:hypothetical protein
MNKLQQPTPESFPSEKKLQAPKLNNFQIKQAKEVIIAARTRCTTDRQAQADFILNYPNQVY